MNRGAGAFPPDRLPPIGNRAFLWLRLLWVMVAAFAICAQLAAIGFEFHTVLVTDRSYSAVGLASTVETDGSVTVGPATATVAAGGVVDESTVLTINGAPVSAGASERFVAHALDAAGPAVALRLRAPDGTVTAHRMARSDSYEREAAATTPIPRPVRLAIRFCPALLSAIAMLAAAILLFLRRPRDPVALLLSFAFLLIAGSIDPPLLMWMSLQVGWIIDWSVGIWWTLLMIAFAAFPDGRFEPRWLRWTIVAAPPVGVVLALDNLDDAILIGCGIVLPLLLLVAQVLRYRRLTAGIERQQLKWAAFGFIAGFVLLGAAIAINALNPDLDVTTLGKALTLIAVLVLFDLAFVLIPAGLLVSVLRFRLWEADRVIGRSAAYAVITIVVGFVVAASADFVKDGVTALLGQSSAPVATTVSALIGACVLAPTQSVVLTWSKRRFEHNNGALGGLPAQLLRWRDTEIPPELGMRALAVIAEAIHAESAALLALTPTGRELIAARDIADPAALEAAGAVPEDDPRFPVILPLADGDGPVGTLLIGPRSDHNRYAAAERASLDPVIEPLAEALRIARTRMARDAGVHRMISAVEERLARLEQPPAPPGGS